MHCNEHLWRDHNTHILRTPSGSKVEVASRVCLRCNDFEPAPLQICVSCLDRQPGPLKSAIWHGVIDGKIDGECDVCKKGGLSCLQALV